MIRCFVENKPSFFAIDVYLFKEEFGVTTDKRGVRNRDTKNEMLNCVKILVTSFSHARAYARMYRSFFVFAVTSVTRHFVILYNTVDYGWFFVCVLTFQRFHPRKIDETTEKNTLFAPSFFQKIIVFLSHFPPKCDTCDSKKSTSLLEGARCAYTRESFAFSSHLAFHLRLGGCLVILSFGVLLIGENSKMEFFKKCIVTFPRFFHSLGRSLPIYL